MADKRAKYNQAARDRMAANGEAMSDGSYPIADREDLERAIRAVGRGNASHDEIRRHIIARAKALGLSDLIPDAWGSDGTVTEQNGYAPIENREKYNDLYFALEQALGDANPDSYYVWLQDFSDTDVIYCEGGDMYSAPYKMYADGAVTLGDPVKVRPVTTYVETNSAKGPLLEWRQRKAEDLKGIERRSFSTEGMELREADDGNLKLTGFACVTDVAYDVGWYQETIRSGAFKRTLSENPDVQLLINHTGLPLARTRSGTLKLEERTSPDHNGKKGLWVEASLDPQDPDVISLKRKMDRRDIDQMSFAFQQNGQVWNDEYTEREITACSIHRGDVSVVNFGANPNTVASLRSAEALTRLGDLGPDAVIRAFQEWRDHTLIPLDQRAGKALSAATMSVLTEVLSLVAAADDAVDEAQPLLAELMGVPNPDADGGEPDEDDAERSADELALEVTVAMPSPERLARARHDIRELRKRREARR